MRALLEQIIRDDDTRNERDRETVNKLAAVLGYELYCADQKTFPGTTEADGYRTGSMTLHGLVDEVLSLLKDYQKVCPSPRDLECPDLSIIPNTAFALSSLSALAYRNSKEKGFHDTTQNIGEELMLVVSELSEALESVRNDAGHKPSEKVSSITNLEEEIADAIIRLLDFSYASNLRIGNAVVAKMKYNRTRPHKHGKKF